MTLFSKPKTNTIDDMLEKFAVKELVEFERFCRDNALWDEMHKCFAEDSSVNISWYQGDGHGFVEASKKSKTKAPHKLYNTLVWLNGRRAMAVTMASIQMRVDSEGKSYDLTSYVRFIYMAEKSDSQWKIRSLNCIYEKDSLVSSTIEEALSSDQQGEYRSSYGNLSMLLEKDGCSIAATLPGDDRPELIEELYKSQFDWLYGK
ncbi:MAG: nuclear transport factor 2 family protein [Clostridiales bacterium]|jgi:hypothetical protein|nr:nuclear transport factor 2 family protein [Clostridiales bacterium]